MVTKQDIIDYVMNTPENTNRAVLQSLLDNVASNEGGGGTYIVKLVPDETPVEWRDGTLDKTVPEIVEAVQSGKTIVIERTTTNMIGMISVEYYYPDIINWSIYESEVVNFHIVKDYENQNISIIGNADGSSYYTITHNNTNS